MKRRLSENLKRVQKRIADACAHAGRSADEVTMVAVTKSVGLDVIRQLVSLGVRDLGENRVAELARRAAMMGEYFSRRAGAGDDGGGLPLPTWHMVGHVQRNKVKHLLPWTHLIHSMDSLRLAEEIDLQAGKLERRADVLLQVNASGESTKFGVAVGAVRHLGEQIATLPHLRLCGLMTMAPLHQPEGARLAFQRCQELFEEMRYEGIGGRGFRHLSMGMSDDLELALEAGANMVRVGRALFDGLEVSKGAANKLGAPTVS